MLRRFPSLIILIASALVSANAVAIDLVAWTAGENAPRVILPKRDAETADQSVERYLRAIRRHPELRALIPPEGFEPAKGRAVPLTDAAASPVRTAFVANWISDMSADGARIQRNLSTFRRAGADPYVIALSADVGLTEAEAAEFRGKVARSFDMLVSLGGDDIAPEAHGEKTTFARGTNLARDRSELALVTAFKKAARGIFFGICRGHQMGALADGHGLHQDLTKTGAGVTRDHINPAGRTSGEMQTWHHVTVEKGTLLERFLRRFADANGGVRVNSVHHQAVNPSPVAGSIVAAAHPTSGVEALQQKNGLGLSVQFHPEFPREISGDTGFSRMGFELIRGVVSYARLQRQRLNAAGACSRVFD